MKNQNIQIGDRVVCIKAHSQGFLVVGREYIVYDIRSCNCEIVYNVGTHKYGSYCDVCGVTVSEVGEESFFSSALFAKVQEKTNYVRIEIEIEEPCLN